MRQRLRANVDHFLGQADIRVSLPHMRYTHKVTVDPSVQTSWENPEPESVTFQIKIRDHGQVYDFTFTATDLRYALATLLIEHHIYLSSADGLEISPVEYE